MKAYLYVLDTLADWEVSFITAELNSGRYLDKAKEKVVLIKIGNTLSPITTMGGMNIAPDDSIDNIKFNDGDLLILPGADTWSNENNQKVIQVVSKLINTKVIIAAICGATIALAQNGLLDNRKHTSNNKDYLKMICPEYSSDNYKDKPAIVDGNLITASGWAPLEFSYEIFKKTAVMKSETLEAWYGLYKTKETRYFYQLMESLK